MLYVISVDNSMDQHDTKNASLCILESISIDFLPKSELITNRKISADTTINDSLDTNSQVFDPVIHLHLEVVVSASHMMQVMEDYLK
jgi:hypothetical protein